MAEPVNEGASEVVERHSLPPNVVVNVGSGRFVRVLCWFGWAGFVVCGLLLISQRIALSEYFDTTEGIEEKYHSGAKYARPKVAVITINGTIVDGSGFVKQQIDRVREDKHVKAVVVRVVSPGGTIAGSDYIFHHLKKLREEKKMPLIVSMGSIATSGGYYVSMAVGDQQKSIFAEPTTTTGSIGVIVPHYDLSKLLARFDVTDDSIVSDPRKQMLSMTRPLGVEDRKLVQTYVDEAFARFKDIVKQGRPAFRADPDALDQLATGEIFSASQAQTHGLVDEIGFIESAIERAMELAKLDPKDTRVIEYKRQASLFDLPMFVRSDSSAADLARLFDLATPQAYYLSTTLPCLATHRTRYGAAEK